MKAKLNHLLNNQNDIVKSWVDEKDLLEVLNKYNIDKNMFTEMYAHGVFDHLLKIISGIREPGTCPIIISLMNFLKHNNVKINHIFTICSLFKKHINLSLIDNRLCNKENYIKINRSIDKNFEGVLEYYVNLSDI